MFFIFRECVLTNFLSSQNHRNVALGPFGLSKRGNTTLVMIIITIVVGIGIRITTFIIRLMFSCSFMSFITMIIIYTTIIYYHSDNGDDGDAAQPLRALS